MNPFNSTNPTTQAIATSFAGCALAIGVSAAAVKAADYAAGWWQERRRAKAQEAANKKAA